MGRGELGPRSAEPRLAQGLLAALPLFGAYELGLAFAEGSPLRCSAEAFALLVLAPLERRLQLARVLLLLAAGAVACGFEAREGARDSPLGRRLAREVALGALAGIFLAPLLAWLHAWLGAAPLLAPEERARGLPATLRLIGAAPWEELLFRLGALSGLYVLARRTSAFLGLDSPLARAGAELLALLASAVLFATFHLDGVQHLLGSAGEPYHAGLFLWRTSAGLLLGGLFRWRGLGAAAWAHAVFNLGVALGLSA